MCNSTKCVCLTKGHFLNCTILVVDITENKDGKIEMADFQKRFGFIAVEKGFITPDQLVEAFKIQVTEEIEKDKHRLIGAILFEQGFITLAQIEEVLESMTTLSAV